MEGFVLQTCLLRKHLSSARTENQVVRKCWKEHVWFLQRTEYRSQRPTLVRIMKQTTKSSQVLKAQALILHESFLG